MKNRFPAFLLASFCAFALNSLSQAEPTASEDQNPANKKVSTPSSDTKYWDKVDRARAEAAEAAALSDKAAAESRLQATLRDRKVDEVVSKAQLETALAREETRKAETEAKHLEATARLLELQIRAAKAQMELQHFTSTAPIHLEIMAAEAKTQKIEAEMKLFKTIELQKKVEKEP
jgi:hypothetical protein